jgi:TetR/AcrR family transcriptional regulator, cholesterol catabolism regulator
MDCSAWWNVFLLCKVCGASLRAINSLASEELGSAAQRARRTRILDAATVLASRGGFEQMQMRAVAERADVALGTLYRYFPSKIHLLVSALAQQLEQALEVFDRKPIPGETPADRVMYVLDRMTLNLQRDPNLTEALTRAFMFADASVAREMHQVGVHVTRMLTTAMRDPLAPPVPAAGPTEDAVAISKVVGDVWFASLVRWVTGRSSANDVSTSMDVAVRLLLR